MNRSECSFLPRETSTFKFIPHKDRHDSVSADCLLYIMICLWFYGTASRPVLYTFVSDDGDEMLLMDSECLWMWIPYISQDELQIGTVAAGHDVNREPLYIARAMLQGMYSIGFYRFRKLLGYFVVHLAVSTTTEMHILVVLWWSYCFTAARYSVNLVWYWRNQNIWILDL